MKTLATAYFVISGVILFLKGSMIITTVAHIGQPITGLYRHEILKASVADDAQQLKQLENGLDHFHRQIRNVINQGQEGGFLLCAVGSFHLVLGALSWRRRAGRVSCDSRPEAAASRISMQPNQHPE